MTYEPVQLEHLLAHQSWAIRVARRLVHEESEAEDLVQRTWIAALRRPPDSLSGARAWIRKVILNLARERHRRAETRERHERARAVPEPVEHDAFEQASRDELHGLLGRQLLALKEPYRSVLVQRYYHDKTSVEIARELGIPAGTVRWRLKIGLDMLRDELDRRSGGDRSRWVSAMLLLPPPGGAQPRATEPRSARKGSGENGGENTVESATGGTSGALALTGWVTLALVTVIGGVLVLQGGERGPSDTVAAAPRLEAEPGLAPSEEAPRARAPAAAATGSLPAPVEQAGPSNPGAGAQLTALVIDAHGEPVADASLLVARADGHEARARSDQAGRALLTLSADDVGALGLTSTRGRVSLRALAPGRAASPLVHVAGPFTREHEVRLVLGGPEVVRRGRLQAADGSPVAGAQVAWFEQEATLAGLPVGDFASPSYLATRTDESGSFVLGHLGSREGQLFSLAAGFATTVTELSGLDPAQPLLIELPRGARLGGRVRWPDGRGAAGARVSAEPRVKATEWAVGLVQYDPARLGFGERAVCDAQGSFQLDGVFPGPRLLWAHAADGSGIAALTLTLEEGSDERWEAVLEEPQGLRLRLVDEGGRPLEGWLAHLRTPLGDGTRWVRRLVADEEGRVWVPDAPRPSASLDVFEPSGAGASYAALRVQTGPEERLVTVETRATCLVSGLLLDEGGSPELGGKLAFRSLRTALKFECERTARGAFEQRLAPGRYLLVLELEHAAARLATLELVTGQHLELGTLSTPALGTLRLDGSALANGDARAPAYSLFALLSEERGELALQVDHGELHGEALLSLYAGAYRVLAFDGAGQPPSVHEVLVAPARESRLHFAR